MKQYIILNTSRKHVNYEEDKNKVPMNKPYNIQNTNICNGIFHISFFKALLVNEGERDSGRNDPVPFLVSCPKGQVETYANVEACGTIDLYWHLFHLMPFLVLL